MSVGSLRVALVPDSITGCAPACVVTTPEPVPAAGSQIRYALRSDPFRFAAGRTISLDADTLEFERFVPGDRGHWIAKRIPTGAPGVRVRLLAVSALPWCLACASATSVLHEPISRGRAYSYAASQDSVAIAASRALRKQGLTLVRDTVAGSTHLLLASRGASFTSWGELDRVAITPVVMGAEVRMISRPVSSGDFLHQDRSPMLFRELDRELGGSAVRPFEGDRVRLILAAPENQTLTGTILPGGDTVSLRVQARDQTRIIPAGDLAGISVSRGSYGHAKEGGLLGMLVGGLVGFIAVSPESSDWSGVEHAAGFLIGSLIGVVAGSAIGGVVRTEVWSDVPATALREQAIPRAAAP